MYDDDSLKESFEKYLRKNNGSPPILVIYGAPKIQEFAGVISVDANCLSAIVRFST